MPAEIEPPELASLVDFAERPRVEDWSLRSALVRYAQPQPHRASLVLSLVRRIESVLHAHAKELGRAGPDIWSALTSVDATGGAQRGFVVELLGATQEVDRLGDLLASWAVDRTDPRPDDAVDAVTAEVASRLDALGVPQEAERPRPAGSRGV